MTEIRNLSNAPSKSGVVPLAAAGLRLLWTTIAAGCLVAMGVFATVVVSFGNDMSSVLIDNLIERMAGLRPGFSCDLSGKVAAEGELNCADYRGFRVRRDGGYRVYSMRYGNPVFVFGVENGLLVRNEKTDERVQVVEQASFMSYFVD